MLWSVSKRFLFFSFCLKSKVNFLWHWELVEFLEVKFTETLDPHCDWASLLFLYIRHVHVEPPAICQMVQISLILALVPVLLGIFLGKLQFSICVCWSLQLGGWQFALWPHFSYGAKNSCWFFSLIGFLFLVRVVEATSSFLHAMLEIKPEVSFFLTSLLERGSCYLFEFCWILLDSFNVFLCTRQIGFRGRGLIWFSFILLVRLDKDGICTSLRRYPISGWLSFCNVSRHW